MKTQTLIITLILCLFILEGPAWAGDGQIDIATLPYTISQPGSYIVTKNLSLATLDTHGITIEADDVILDLNGHTLAGPGKSTGTTGSGIFFSGTRINITVRNGILKEWRASSIYAFGSSNARFESLVCQNNGQYGIYGGGDGSIFINNICNNNGAYGIDAGSGSVIAKNSCRSNTGMGISAGLGCTVTENSCTNNSYNGIYAASGSIVTGNAAMNNTMLGIGAGYGSTITGNTCNNNDTDGIFTESGCHVSGNNCIRNTGNGIRVFSECQVFDNTCTYNGYLTGDGAGILAVNSNNKITNNLCTNNDRGLDLDGGSNIVSGNILRANTISLDAVADNQLDILISDLPYTISQSGVYRLSGSLAVSAQDADGIYINTDNVTLDLSGFSLIGPGKSSGTIGNGISVGVTGYKNIVIRNGIIRDWRENGVYAASVSIGGKCEALHCYNNGGKGIYAGYTSIVNGNTATGNGSDGIHIRQGSIVKDNICSGNGGNGILSEGFVTLERNVCRSNTLDGINADMDCLLQNNNSDNNTGDGIEVRLRCRVVNNVCNGNGNSGDGAGINVTDTGAGNTIEQNQVGSNDRGIGCNPSTENYIAGNRARANTANYDILAGNTQGSGDLTNVTY